MLAGGPAVALAGLAIAVVAVAPASAHEPPDRSQPPDGSGLIEATGVAGLVAALGETVAVRADGLYAVTLDDGTELATHGPDPTAAFAAQAGGLRAGPRRDPVCARDRQTRFALARPPGAPPSRSAARSVRLSLERANALLSDSARFSGGPEADLKVACDRDRRLEVERFETRAHDFAAVVSAARRAGLRSPRANYVIFARARVGDVCGTSSFRADDRAGIENANRDGGGYAVIYGNCRGSAEVLLHEVAHMLGAVQYGAPYSTGSGRHCWDELDVLCYVPDGGNLHQAGVVSRCLMITFDCGYDTYFDAAPEPGQYLATHWNLGSPLNRFVRFAVPAPAG